MSVATDNIGELPVSDGVWTVDPDRNATNICAHPTSSTPSDIPRSCAPRQPSPPAIVA
jgi:hypothetical protein